MTKDTQPTIAELGEYLLNKHAEQLEKASAQKRIIVAIAGIPGAGKTHVSQLLCEYVNKHQQKNSKDICTVVPMDGFHYTKAQLLQQATSKGVSLDEIMLRRGAHWTFDSANFVQAIRKLQSESKATHKLPSFDHAIGDPITDDIILRSHHQIVLIEGIYLHLSISPWNEINQIVDKLWWVEPRSKVTSSNRLAKRHFNAGLSDSIAAAEQRIINNDLPNSIFTEENRLPPSRTIFN